MAGIKGMPMAANLLQNQIATSPDFQNGKVDITRRRLRRCGILFWDIAIRPSESDGHFPRPELILTDGLASLFPVGQKRRQALVGQWMIGQPCKGGWWNGRHIGTGKGAILDMVGAAQ